MARDKQLISKALDTMARVQCLNGTDLSSLSASDEKCYEYEGPILQEQHITFNLQIPGPVPPYLNIHYICESGSRLLFLSIHWTRNIPAFQYLATETQITLLRGCWAELFTLGLAQCSQTLSLSTILSALISHLHTLIAQDKMSATKVKQISDHIVKLQDYATSMNRLNVDEHEYAYLKAITLFSADQPDILLRKHVEKLQEKSFQALKNYVHNSFPDDTDRFPRWVDVLHTLEIVTLYWFQAAAASSSTSWLGTDSLRRVVLRRFNRTSANRQCDSVHSAHGQWDADAYE